MVSFLLQARYKPIVSTLEDIFMSVMSRVGNKHELSQSYEWKICPRIMKKLEKEKNKSRWWQAVPAGAGK